MPLTIETGSHRPTADIGTLRAQRDARSALSRRIRVGLVNNMPDAALRATERQFASLLEEASGDYDVRLALINLDSVPREAAAREAIAENYRSIASLRLTDFDALIFTGAEPRAPDLRQEPYWRELTELMDWARSHLISNFYSCLAAHVAVLHRDGIERKRLPNKLSGVFACEIIASHPLVDGVGAEFLMPHSRYNDLSQKDLIDKRYLPLASSAESGVAIFVKEGDGLEVFVQGHPEYEPDTLAREYRRDVLRFIQGLSTRPPLAPVGYFAPDVASRLASRMADTTVGPIDDLAQDLRPEALSPGEASWRASSQRLFGNWLAAIARRKAERIESVVPIARRERL